MQTKLLAASVLTACLCVGNANADIRFNGFASIFGGMTLGDGETLYGYDDSFSADPDTLVALQGVSDLGDGLSATVQLIARGSDDYDVELEWGYLSYEFSDRLKLNAGRLRVPFFRYSDFLDVGYAYYWNRPPQAVYDLPFQNLTGASLIYSYPLQDWDLLLQITGGRKDNSPLPIGAEIGRLDTENLIGGALEASRDWLTLRAAYYQAKLDFTIPSIDLAVEQFEQAGLIELADTLALNDDSASFLGLGFGVDHNNLIINGEWIRIDVDDAFSPEQESWYLSLAYRFGDWTPHVTYEELQEETVSNALSLAPTPTTQAITTAILRGAVENNDAITVGLRYNFHPSAAFKIDYVSFNGDDPSGTDADLISFGVDLIF